MISITISMTAVHATAVILKKGESLKLSPDISENQLLDSDLTAMGLIFL